MSGEHDVVHSFFGSFIVFFYVRAVYISYLINKRSKSRNMQKQGLDDMFPYDSHSIAVRCVSALCKSQRNRFPGQFLPVSTSKRCRVAAPKPSLCHQ